MVDEDNSNKDAVTTVVTAVPVEDATPSAMEAPPPTSESSDDKNPDLKEEVDNGKQDNDEEVDAVMVDVEKVEEEKTDSVEKVEEDKQGETPAATPAPAPAATAPTPTGRRSSFGRERKSTSILDTSQESKKKEICIEQGTGTTLAAMPIVVENLKKITYNDPSLKAVYGIVFGQGKKKEFKKHLLQFNGFVYSAAAETAAATMILGAEATAAIEKRTVADIRDKKKEKMYKLKMDELKAVMDLLDIDRCPESFADDGQPEEGATKKKGIDKEMLCTRFLEWLESPTINTSGKPPASSKKKKKKKRKSSTTTTAVTKTSTTTATKKRKSTTDAAAAKKKKKKTTTTAATTAKKKKSKAVVVVAAAEDDDTETEDDDDSVLACTIPGVSGEKMRAKVGQIVSKADKDTLTVKGVRKLMEDWLDTDLSQHKDYIRALTMEFLC